MGLLIWCGNLFLETSKLKFRLPILCLDFYYVQFGALSSISWQIWLEMSEQSQYAKKKNQEDAILYKYKLKGKWKPLSCVWLFATTWTIACQASLSITNSWSLLNLMSIESVMQSNHFILCHPLLLLPSIFSIIKFIVIDWKNEWTCLRSASIKLQNMIWV